MPTYADVTAKNGRRHRLQRTAFPIPAEGVGGPFAGRGKVELAVGGPAVGQDEGLEARVAPETVYALGPARLRYRQDARATDVSLVEFLYGWKIPPQGVSDRYVAGIDTAIGYDRRAWDSLPLKAMTPLP